VVAKTSISIDDADLAWLKKRAKRLHGGNLSAAMAEGTEILRHLDRMGALLDRLAAPKLTDADRTVIDRELHGPTARRSAKRGKRAA
jgi:hypothetical protein